jgi:transposase InsO family protein
MYASRFILSVIDCFSKFLWLFALPTKEAHHVAECLVTIFDRYGFDAPNILQSDNGTEFCNLLITELKKKYNILHITS